MNWDDPAERAALIERVGVTEYNRMVAQHRKDSVVVTVNGYEIRQVDSPRFGRLFAVGKTGSAFTTQAQAITWASQQPKRK